MKTKKKRTIKKKWEKEKGLFSAIVILSVLVIALFIYDYAPQLKSYKSAGVKQYSVKIIEITGNCEDCFNISTLADTLVKEGNVKVKSRERLNYNSPEAEKIIDKYNIEAVPALVVLSRDIKKIGIDEKVFSTGDGYALFDKGVPYIDLNSGKLKGLVQLKEIQPKNCTECISLSQLKSQFEKLGIKVKGYEIVGSSSENGKELIEKNNLTFIPALLISKDIEEYWWIFDQIKDSFAEKADNYIFKIPLAPYVDLSDGKVKGRVDIILLKNESCGDCFDVNELKSSFMGVGVYFDSEKSVDVSSGEGRGLLKKYNITAIPTVILSKEILDYDSIEKMLGQLGTFEGDGKFVFRKLASLKGKYQEIPPRA